MGIRRVEKVEINAEIDLLRKQRLMATFSQDCKFPLWGLKEVAGLFKTIKNQQP